MTEQDQRPVCSRRRYLRAGAVASTLGLAGCTMPTFGGTPSEDTSNPTPSEETTETSDIPPAEPAAHFYSSSQDGKPTIEFTYDDLPEFQGPREINERNAGHPSTANIEVSIEDERVTARILQIALIRDVTIQLWAKRPDGWTDIDETTIAANNDTEDIENLEYHTEELEFTGTPPIETHIASAYSLVIIDPPYVPEWDTHTPGRVLKTVRMFAIPYDSPEGRKTRIFDGEQVNFKSHDGTLDKPSLRNTTVVEDQSDGSKAVFAVVRTPRGEYGVSTTISPEAVETQNYSRDVWTALLRDNRTAEDYTHFQTLARELRTVHQKLGNWGTLRQKLRAYGDFTAALTYSRRGAQNMRHPTACLLSPKGRNCTEKTLLFMALIQCAPFNYSGEDATYIYCSYNGGAHLVAGINTDKFDSLNEDWDRYSYSERVIEALDVPEDAEFIPIDVTNGYVGRLGSGFSDILILDNLDAEHGYQN